MGSSQEGKDVDTHIRSLGDLIRQQEAVSPEPTRPVIAPPPGPIATTPPPPSPKPRTQTKHRQASQPVPEKPLFNGPLTFNLPIENATKPACGCSGEATYNQGIAIAAQSSCPKCQTVGEYPGIVQDSGPGTVFLHNGEFSHHSVDLEIPGRGINWKFERKYRSGVIFDGPLGHNWELNYNRRLFVETTGSVTRMDGMGRADRYALSAGRYSAPAGFYTRLRRDRDGTFVERDKRGTKVIYGRPDRNGIARMTELRDGNGNRMRFEHNRRGQLIRVIDTLGRAIVYRYNEKARLVEVEDFAGRKIRFDYDRNGDLVAVTSPSVTGTPNGNDFPDGTTTRYVYSSGVADERLNHNLIQIIAPNEVASGGPARVRIEYETNPASPNADRVLRQTIGGVNASGVPAGGAIAYEYRALGTAAPGDLVTPVFQNSVTDRNGNRTEYRFNRAGNIVRIRELSNRRLRPGDPQFFETRYEYNKDGEMVRMTFPEGNSVEYVYDEQSPRRLQQGNLLRVIRRPDAKRGADQTVIATSYTYEPIYNQIRSVTEERGNDASYVPQNGGANSPERYTTVYLFDYQEGDNLAPLAEQLGTDLSAVRSLLKHAGVRTGLGDLNGDRATNQISGNTVKIAHPTVNLPPGSNMAQIEGGNQQPIVELLSYNRFGQITSRVDPEGNVDVYKYYPENDPDGDGRDLTPDVSASPFGYLHRVTRDTMSEGGRNSKTNPAPTNIRRLFRYDRVGNVIREVDGRGIATDYAVNQLSQVVQVARAAATDVFAPDPPEPRPLAGFRYLERKFYDFNGNLVRNQVEDRGNTSGVGADNGGSGTAFVDYEHRYDILDTLIETRQEVNDNDTLVTRYRYDANGNQVLVIEPEGNAYASAYDERDLLFQQSRGATVPPPFALSAVSDPTRYDVRGGKPSTQTYQYDRNRNLTVQLNGRQHPIRYIYDGFDRRASVVDAAGNQTVMQYDPAANVVRVSRFGPVGGRSPTSAGISPLAGAVSSGGVIQATNLVNQNLLEATESGYDELGRVFQTDRVLFVNTVPTLRPPDLRDGAADIGKDNLTPGDDQPIPGISGIDIIGRVTDRLEYDRNSRPMFGIEDDGDTARVYYDGADRVIRAEDAEGNTVETAYDDDNNTVETKEIDVSQVAGVPNETFLTTFFYDSLNRIQQRVDNIGQTVDYRYDSRDNLVAMADAEGPSGPTITRRAFAGGTRTINATNRFGNVTLYSYDGIDRKLREDIVLTASGQGDGSHMGADIFGVREKMPAPDRSQGGGDGLMSVRYEYDRNSLLKGFTDDNGNQTRYSFDNLNRRSAETDGNCLVPGKAGRCDSPTTTTYEYDADDNIVRKTDENGSIVASEFDVLDRRIAETITRAPGVAGTTATACEYDGLSRLTRATDNNDPGDVDDDSTVTFAYDSLSRVLEETQQIGSLPVKAISSGRRSENLRSGLTYPSGRRVTFTYDRIDRINTVRDDGAEQPIADYDYIGRARVAQRRYPLNKTRMTFLNDAGNTDAGYDGIRRPVQLRHLREDNSLLIGFAQSYDRTNNKLVEEKLHAKRESELYHYDSADRLIEFQRGSLSQTKDAISVPSADRPLQSAWTLDGVGNWERIDGETRQHSSLNEIVQRDANGVMTPLHDSNGNITDDGTFVFLWDHLNRLRRVIQKEGNAVVAVYSYDAVGRRIRKVVANSDPINGSTDFYLSGWRELEERNDSDRVVKQYVYGNEVDEPLVVDGHAGGGEMAAGVGDQRLFYQQDTLGSVVGLTDMVGALSESYEYEAYGREKIFQRQGEASVGDRDGSAGARASLHPMGNPYLFTGRRLDGETGLYYYRLRYMDPDLGRFMSRDPKGYSGRGLNLYEYAYSNPAGVVDSFGTDGTETATGGSGEGNSASGNGQACGPKCGPNVTGALHTVLVKMASDWLWAPAPQKDDLRLALYTDISFGWDINQLFTPSMVLSPQTRTAGCAQSYPCRDTVDVCGTCWTAGVVNYLMWGLTNRLSGTDLAQELAHVAYSNPVLSAKVVANLAMWTSWQWDRAWGKPTGPRPTLGSENFMDEARMAACGRTFVIMQGPCQNCAHGHFMLQSFGPFCRCVRRQDANSSRLQKGCQQCPVSYRGTFTYKWGSKRG